MDKAAIRKAMLARRRQVPHAERDAYSQLVCRRLAAYPARLVCLYRAFPDEIDLSEFASGCAEVVYPEKRGGIYVVERAREVDLWVCPGLAFTRDGKRIGFGGGWYDRFLAQAKPCALKLGVAYPWQIVADLPQESTDVRLDGVIHVE